MPRTKRKDKSRVVLRTGESQRADGTYHFSWTDANHKRRYVYAKTLDELRYKEEQIAKDKSDGIKAEARYTTVWCCIIKVDTLFSRILIYNHNQYENRRKTYGTESKIL